MAGAISLVLFLYHRHVSAQTFFFKRAPQIPISNLHTFDDTWVTGGIKVPKPLVAPYFLHQSVYYQYLLHEKRIRNKIDPKGRVRQVEHWELIKTISNSTPFLLDDGSGQIAIDPAKAVIKFPLKDFFYDGHWRHTLTYIPVTSIVSSVGVVSETKDQLIAKGKIPLMLTPHGRKKFFEALKSEQRIFRYGALGILWCSITMLLCGISRTMGFMSGSDGSLLLKMAMISFAPLSVFYSYFVYNSLVTLRQNLVNSWANVDVDLKARRELIPNLVQTVEGYLQHEKTLLVQLSSLRESLDKETRLSRRISFENEVSDQVKVVTARVEAIPNLKEEHCLKWITELKTIENKIGHAKSHFNAVAEDYNSLVESFPASILARGLKFTSVPYYGQLEPKRDLGTLGKSNGSEPIDKKVA